MEAYKSTCPDCKAVYYWTGRKTAFNAHDAAEMEKEQTICKKCGSTKLKTELDHESAAGQDMDDMYKDVLSFLGEALKKGGTNDKKN